MDFPAVRPSGFTKASRGFCCGPTWGLHNLGVETGYCVFSSLACTRNSSTIFLRPLPRFWVMPIAVACSVFIAGCTHTSRFDGQSTAVAVPTQWSSTAAQPEQRTPEDLSRWWQRFGDAQMTALIEQSLQANPSVQSAQSSLRQARAQLDVQAASLASPAQVLALTEGVAGRWRQWRQ